MDAIKSFIGTNLFGSLMDPNIDKLASEYGSRLTGSLSSFHGVLDQANSTKDILSKIPGVSSLTKGNLDKLLEEAKSFSQNPGSLTPTALIQKKAEVNAKIKVIVDTAKDEAKSITLKDAAEKLQAAKEKVENATFSFNRFMSRVWNFILIFAAVVIVLYGGRLSSMNSYNYGEALHFRLYYFIYGCLLFPISYIAAMRRSFLGIKPPGPNCEVLLAPLIDYDGSSWWVKILFFLFVFKRIILPVDITEPVVNPVVAPEPKAPEILV